MALKPPGKPLDGFTNASYVLPYPPSVNHYWRVVRGRPIISREGRAYREHVRLIRPTHGGRPIAGRLVVSITAHTPDRRARDLDNLLKALLDALQHAGAYADDAAIDDLRIRRGDVIRPAWCQVWIEQVSGRLPS